MHHSYYHDDLFLVSSHISALDIEDNSYEAHYDGSHEPHLSPDYFFTHDTISRVYMAVEVITSFDIQNSWIVDNGANKHMSHNLQ